MDRAARHLQLLTDTIAAVNSTLDLHEVLERVAARVAEATETDACFVYLLDEASGRLELRATHGARFDDPAHRPSLALGEGITGASALERQPIMIARDAHLDPRFRSFANLPEDEYQSILAVPVLARADAPGGGDLRGALNVRTRRPRRFRADEIDLLTAIAAQVAGAIQNAKLYERSQRRVAELEALSRISEAVTSSLYQEDVLAAIVSGAARALAADGCAVVVHEEDGPAIGYRFGAVPADEALVALADRAPFDSDRAVARALRWRGRPIGALVALAAEPRAWSREELSLLDTLSHQAAAAVGAARAALRGLLAQEIHHRVKNNLQTVASLLRLQLARVEDDPRAADALRDSINRILSIAAVHDLLTESREDDVDCADLIRRLQAMLAAGERARPPRLEPLVLGGQRATALALVFSELFANAAEHGAGAIDVSLAVLDGTARLTVADEGPGPAPGAADGLGLTIARALVDEQLGGRLEVTADGGGRAVVAFPAGS